MNNDAMWNNFLGDLSRTARRHYSERRTCVRCDKPVIDSNRHGLCRNCTGSRGATRRGESQKHKELKALAVDFLRGWGAKEIHEEYVIERRRVDVMGMVGDRKIAVECGGSLRSKLQHIECIVDELYIFPYGASEPFLWSDEVELCRFCGRRV